MQIVQINLMMMIRVQTLRHPCTIVMKNSDYDEVIGFVVTLTYGQGWSTRIMCRPLKRIPRSVRSSVQFQRPAGVDTIL